MNIAYGWAFTNPVRKVYYNITITGLSVGVAFSVGRRARPGCCPRAPPQRRAGDDLAGFNLNTAGYLVVGLFVFVWTSRPHAVALRPRRGPLGGRCARSAEQRGGT